MEIMDGGGIGSSVVRDLRNRREDSRDRIIRASASLFFEQGYEKTTTRQIIQRSGVLNGSLYHAFRNKDEIFKEIVMEALEDVLHESEEQLKRNFNPLVAIVYPAAIELYTASNSKNVADLLYHAHQSWSVMNGFIEVTHKWVSEQLIRLNIDVNLDNYERNVLALMGCVGSYIEEYHLTDNNVPYKDNLKAVIIVVCALFGLQIFDVNKIVNEICKHLESERVSVLGLTI
ncbi:MAG: TetR/AcrR family transcriptional regulator [Candidatus Methanogranum gryphiswaldense]|nr:MAG: TetR/AcrR family transcriptional regulator [Candidatus Methanogranum sp. U3.2.1]